MAAGGIYTPFLLQLSGYTNPEIGRNLTTHYGCNMILAVEANPSDNFTFSSGPLSFVPRNNERERSWQLVVSGGVNQSLLKDTSFRPGPNTRLFSFLLWDLKPRTRGTIAVNTDTVKPEVNLNLFGDGSYTDPESDMSSIMDGLRWMYSISQELTQIYPTLTPVFPPVSVLRDNNPAILETYIRQGLSLTDHYCGTCRLGPVVDPDTFLLRDSNNIHIVDASTFPEISDGNTSYPVMTMAEIASQRIGNEIDIRGP